MTNQLSTETKTFSLTPTSLDEALRYSEMLASSNFVPNSFKGKPGDILVAVQMGAGLGLPPMAALQNIAVINGKPCIWGDAMLAICQNHPKHRSIHEEYIEDEKGNHKAVCTIVRGDEQPYSVAFSVQDAKDAGLWGKVGPWKSYPKRMLQMRARGFALRDKFADGLNGLITREEAEDYPREMKVVNPKTKSKFASKADEIASMMEPEEDYTDIEMVTEEADEYGEIIEPKPPTKIKRMIDRLYELGLTEESLYEELGVYCLEDITEMHENAIINLGRSLKNA